MLGRIVRTPLDTILNRLRGGRYTLKDGIHHFDMDSTYLNNLTYAIKNELPVRPIIIQQYDNGEILSGSKVLIGLLMLRYNYAIDNWITIEDNKIIDGVVTIKTSLSEEIRGDV
jgi:hypothetical protein